MQAWLGVNMFIQILIYHIKEERNMKKLIMPLLLLITLSACSNNSNATEESKDTGTETKKVVDVKSDTEEKEEEKNDEDPLEVKDGPLLEVGQYKNDKYYGKVSLLKINEPDVTTDIISGLTATVKNIKLLNYEDVPENAREDAYYVYGSDAQQFYLIQINYSLDNKNDFEINGTSGSTLVLSDGEQIQKNTFDDRTELYNLKAGAKASDQFSFWVVPSTDINSVKLYFNPHDKDGYEIEESKPLEIPL